jgi:uncharacterized RDD family membrane protein YckC
MKCRYCGAENDPADHRCLRCGRRLHLANARPAPQTYPIKTATAPAVATRELVIVDRSILDAEPERPKRRPAQAALFEAMEPVKVIPFEVPAGSRAVRQRKPVSRPRTERQHSQQQSLVFRESQPAAPVVSRSGVENSIYCDAPVASIEHRALAFCLDLLLILTAVGLFALIFYFGGGLVPALQSDPKLVWGILGGFGTLIYFLYEFVWALAGGATLGMRWARLRLLNFDGRPPDLGARLLRLVSYVLSVLPAGLGIIWAMFDEEKLGWQDHMSNTFPTYAEPSRR